MNEWDNLEMIPQYTIDKWRITRENLEIFDKLQRDNKLDELRKFFKNVSLGRYLVSELLEERKLEK